MALVYKLSSMVKKGDKIDIYKKGWRNITGVTNEGAETKHGVVKYGTVISG